MLVELQLTSSNLVDTCCLQFVNCLARNPQTCNYQTHRLPTRRLATHWLTFQNHSDIGFLFPDPLVFGTYKEFKDYLACKLKAVLIMSSTLKIKISRQILGFILPFTFNFIGFHYCLSIE